MSWASPGPHRVPDLPAPTPAAKALPSAVALRRRRWLWALGSLGLAGAAGAAYTRFCEARWLEITHHVVPLRATETKPIRILHLSDLHASACVPLEFISEAVRLGLAEKPDLICLTGDFITKHFADWNAYAAVLKPLAAAAPVFACLGNHDGGKWAARPAYGGHADHRAIRSCLAASGVKVLLNQSEEIRLRDRRVRLVGVGDLWGEELHAAEAFGASAAADLTLLLMHNPDGKDAVAGFRWDLALCGHTHGGQLRLPWLGTPFAPVRDHLYVAGLNRWRDRWIFTTRGVGNLHGVRFNCRPEVSLLHLA